MMTVELRQANRLDHRAWSLIPTGPRAPPHLLSAPGKAWESDRIESQVGGLPTGSSAP
jgi:hypothetical protein